MTIPRIHIQIDGAAGWSSCVGEILILADMACENSFADRGCGRIPTWTRRGGISWFYTRCDAFKVLQLARWMIRQYTKCKHKRLRRSLYRLCWMGNTT